MLQSFFKDFIIGPGKHIKPWSTYGRVMLTGAIALLINGVCLFYLVWDLFDNVGRPLGLYLTFMVGATVAFVINRLGWYNLAKYTLLVSTNLTVYLFAAWASEEVGAYMFFVPSCIGAFALFSYEEWYKGLFFTMLTLALFLLSVLVDYSPFAKIQEPPVYRLLDFTINFMVCSVVSVVILLFFLYVNSKSEKELKSKQYHLIAMADELRKSRNRFELAIKGSSAGIWDWDLTENTLYCSPLLLDMLGYSSEALRNLSFKQFIDMVYHEDQQRVEAALKSHLRHRTPFKEEFRMRTNNIGDIWVLDTGQAEWDVTGEAVRMVGTLVDITERKNTENQVHQQNQMLAKTNAELDRFVYSASHDLRAPLMSVLGLVRIATDATDPEEVTRYLGMMAKRVETLDIFIQEIIDYSRNARIDVDRVPVELAPIVSGVFESLKFMDGFDRIQAQVDIPTDLTIYSDPSRLKVVLNNLVSNSIKYGDKSKTQPFIKIKAQTSEGDLYLVVEDNGEGIAEASQEKVFDMFYRASERSKGSGLGLYIVKEIVDKLGGTVAVESSLGVGSIFTLCLPGAAEQA